MASTDRIKFKVIDESRWDEKAGLRTGCGVRSQVIDVLEAQIKRRTAMKKVSTAAAKATKNFSQPKLTIGLDLGDRSSWHCLLDEVGEVLREQKLGTTSKAMKEVFTAMPRSRIALETGMHSPWVSRLSLRTSSLPCVIPGVSRCGGLMAVGSGALTDASCVADR